MTFRTSTSPIKAGSFLIVATLTFALPRSALFVFSVILPTTSAPSISIVDGERSMLSVVASVTLIFFTTLLYPINE